jgi:hypothetical protein
MNCKGLLLLLLLFGFDETLSAQKRFAPNTIPYYKGGLIGFCDSAKKIIVPPIYNEVDILSATLLRGYSDKGFYDLYTSKGKKLMTLNGMSDFEDGYSVISVNNLAGLIDTNGTAVIPPTYPGGVNNIKEGFYVCGKTYNGFVVVDTKGRQILALDSGSISNFYHGHAWIKTGHALANVDRNGNIRWLRTNPKYNYMYDALGCMIFTIKDKNDCGIINRDGKEILSPAGYTSIKQFDRTLFQLEKGEDNIGLADSTGKVILLPVYQKFEAEDQETNKPGQFFKEKRWRQLYIVIKDNLRGMIDSTGKFIVPVEFTGIGPVDEDMIVVIKNRKYGYYDINGKEIVSAQYEAENFKDGIASVKENGKYRLINRSGKYINEEIYDRAGDSNPYFHQDSLISVSKNGKWGIVNAQGKTIVPFIYNEAGFFAHHIILIKKDSLFGTLDMHGNTLAPIEYSWIGNVSDGYCWALRKGEYVILDSTGHETKPANKCMINKTSHYFRYGYSDVMINGKRSIVNTKGQVLPSWLKYDYVGVYDHWFVVGKDNKYGALNENEQIILPVKYDGGIRRVSPSIYTVKQNNRYVYVNVNGTEYFED